MAADTTFVIEEADVEPVRQDGDTATVRVTFSASNGSERLEQRIVRYARGRSADRALDGRQEILYVAAGEGQLEIGRELHELRPGTGAFITPGETYAIENPGPGEQVQIKGREVDLGFKRPPRLEAFPGVGVKRIQEIKPIAITSPAPSKTAHE